jgi:hypothetical protein
MFVMIFRGFFLRMRSISEDLSTVNLYTHFIFMKIFRRFLLGKKSFQINAVGKSIPHFMLNNYFHTHLSFKDKVKKIMVHLDTLQITIIYRLFVMHVA